MTERITVGQAYSIGSLKCHLCGEIGVRRESSYEGSFYSCDKCNEVMRGLRTVVKTLSSSGSSKEVKLEKEVTTLQLKLSEKNEEVSKLQSHVTLLEQRILQLEGQQGGNMNGMQMGALNDNGGIGGFMGNNMMNQGMNMGSGGMKRGFDGPMDNGMAFKKRSTELRILFIADGSLRSIVMNNRLQTEFYRRDWQMRLNRTANAAKILEALRKQLDIDDKYDHVIICAGGLDMEEICRTNDETSRNAMANELVATIRDMAQVSAGEHNLVTWLVAPPPRHNVVPWMREQVGRRLVAELAGDNSPAKANLVRIEGTEDDEFYVNTKLHDGIHIKQDWEVPLVERLLHSCGIDHQFPPDDQLNKMQLFGPTVCWKCGGDHKRGQAPCREFDICERCCDTSHHADVCLFLAKMCTSCGLRGHGPKSAYCPHSDKPVPNTGH